MGNFATYVTVLAALLPYLKTSPLTSDVQPHFLVAFFGLYVWTRSADVWSDRKLPLALALGVIYGTAVLLLGGPSYAVGLLFVPVFTVMLTHDSKRILDRCAKIAVVIYLAGCLAEIAGGGALVNRVLQNSRASDSRGFHSFASEPSYLAIIGLVLFVYLLWSRQRWPWIGGSVLIAILSGAVTGIAPLALVAGVFSLSSLSLRKVATYVCLVVVILWTLSHVLDTDSRLYRITSGSYASPSSVLSDVSASNRLIRSIGPIYLAYQGDFVPHAYHDGTELYVDWTFVSPRAYPFVDRLSNLFSILSYAFGYLALPFLIVCSLSIRSRAYVLLAAIYLCVTNISITTPYAPIIFALLLVPDTRNWEKGGEDTQSAT